MEWRLERGPYAGQVVEAYPGAMLVARTVITREGQTLDVLYRPVRMDGPVIVAEYEGHVVRA